MANDSNSGGTVLVAFALGALAGAAVALLYAPAAGEETRRRLGDKAREGRKRAEELAREGSEFLSEQRDAISNALDRGREAFEKGRKEPV
jgi:gas vesicle protein